MELGIWRLLLDENLPPRLREALTIADRSASPELSRRARSLAAEQLRQAYCLTVADVASLMDLELPPELTLAA